MTASCEPSGHLNTMWFICSTNSSEGRRTCDSRLPLATRAGFLVTQDKRIRSRPHERRALLGAGVGAFVFTGRAERSTDELAILILKHLQRIKELAAKTKRPFIFGISDRGKFERLT